MKTLASEMLRIFAHSPTNFFTTSDISKLVFSEEFNDLQLSYDTGVIKKREYDRKRLSLNRRCIYHLNALVDKGALSFQYGEKGAKRFSYVKSASVVSGASNNLSSVVAQFQNEQFVKSFAPSMEPFDAKGWFKKFNGVGLIFSGPDSLMARIKELRHLVNDFIIIYGCDGILSYNYDVIKSFFISLQKNCSAEGIDVHFVFNASASFNFLSQNQSFCRQGAIFTFRDKKWNDVSGKGFEKSMRYLIVHPDSQRLFLQTKTGVHILPVDLDGVDSFDVCVFSANTFIYKSAYNANSNASKLLEQCKCASGDFFRLFAVKRETGLQFFGSKANIAKFRFNFTRSYNSIVLPVESLLKTGFDVNILLEIESEIAKFCANQERAFKSCGLPICFSVRLVASNIYAQNLFDHCKLRSIPEGSDIGLLVKSYLIKEGFDQLFINHKGDSSLGRFFS